jgi:hypothetical protein
MTMVRFLPGDGTETEVDVAIIAEFPRDDQWMCAFCHGDPCAESNDRSTAIAQYFDRNAQAQTCPMCDGRPS